MNIIEIKNATKQELIEYLESWGFAAYEGESIATLREAALENYWTENENYGCSYETINQLY